MVTVISQWVHSMGSAGAVANAGRACRARQDVEAALDARLEDLVPVMSSASDAVTYGAAIAGAANQQLAA